jgi:hypothetical protein
MFRFPLQYPLTADLAMTTVVDPAGALIHVRLEAPADKWFAIGIGASLLDGMTGGDAWAVYQQSAAAGGAWVVEDQFMTGQSTPAADALQNLQSAATWIDNITTLRVATFSRMLVTADTMFDKPIAADSMSLVWALGKSPTYAVHADSESGGSGYFVYDFFNAREVAPTSTPPPPGTAPPVCPMQCSRQGVCVGSDANAVCHCNRGFLGPACAITNGNSVAPASGKVPNVSLLTLTSQIEPVLSMIHFRVDSAYPHWFGIGLNVSAADGMSGGDMTCVYFSARLGGWVVSDQFANGTSPPIADVQQVVTCFTISIFTHVFTSFSFNVHKFVLQDLLHTAAWIDATTGGLQASWSRKLDTGDLQDAVIYAGVLTEVAFAIGNGPFFSLHSNSENGGAAHMQLNFCESIVPIPTNNVPAGTVPTCVSAAIPPSAAAVCTTNAQCMNAAKCNVAAGVCACASAAFVGPTCAVPVP